MSFLISLYGHDVEWRRWTKYFLGETFAPDRTMAANQPFTREDVFRVIVNLEQTSP